MKYQAHIKHVCGELISVIWDDDLNRFIEEIKLAAKDLAAYLGESDFQYDNKNLSIDLYMEDARDLIALLESRK